MAVCKINFIENRKVLKLKYVRICHLLNSYSKQLGGTLSPEKSLIAANCIFIIHPYTLTVADQIWPDRAQTQRDKLSNIDC